ncbi:hypothetical protein MUK42_05149 [Musa troglodytarum]|uniref:Protein LURP-one-related 15 n=1 Tax=Musa troglodytarum TaxID=320322 RepID=A0A9E7JFQ9_9LILI|nr:hypothetical protein MUK42_05149 [Musa troglodytarum]
MSSPSSQFAAASGAIVDPRFCVSYPIDLTFFNDAAWLNCDRLAVTDTDGNVVFKVEADKCSLRSRQVVVDASGKPVISMQQKLRSVHERWQVFKGDSSDAKHLLFSVRRSSALQFKTELDVFLAANTEEEACDFKTKGSYRKRSCAMSKEYKFANSSVSKDAFGVAINPNTDYCFIAALLIIQHELHKEGSETAGAIGESSGAIVAGIFEGLAAALVEMVADGGAAPRGSAAAAASLRRCRPGGGGGGAAAGGGASTMLQCYTDDAKMSPNTVLFVSIAVVALLHVVGELHFVRHVCVRLLISLKMHS